MAVEYTAKRLNISWIAVLLTARAKAIFKPFGKTSPTLHWMLFGIHKPFGLVHIKPLVGPLTAFRIPAIHSDLAIQRLDNETMAVEEWTTNSKSTDGSLVWNKLARVTESALNVYRLTSHHPEITSFVRVDIARCLSKVPEPKAIRDSYQCYQNHLRKGPPR